MLWDVLDYKKRFEKVYKKLQDLMRYSNPLPFSPTHKSLLMWLTHMTFDLNDEPGPNEILDMICEEVQARVERGWGVVEKDSPRILAICPNHITDPRQEHLFNEMGIAIVATDSEFSALEGTPSVEGIECKEEVTAKDPYLEMSNFVQSSLHYFLGGRVKIILEACKKLKVDGVWDRYHAG